MSKVQWHELLDDFGRRILRQLGYDPYRLPRDHNPITRKLKEDKGFVARNESDTDFNRISLSRVATICQMVVFDAQNGPEGDGKAKALRRHWYQWYKVDFAQPLALQYGDYEVIGGVKSINDLSWTSRLSVTYGEFVDSGEVTYQDLWVEDASRMIKRIDAELFNGANIIIAVEKDSLFSDFEAAAKALGARAIYSGKGKSSKAAIEKLLREHFGWGRERWDEEAYAYITHNPFTAENPLVILHISDWDFDGEAVIGPTFGEQASRYSDYIREARIGVNPIDVEEKGYNLDNVMYQAKISHKGSRQWAEDKALFVAECSFCGNHEVVESVDPGLSNCCGEAYLTLSVGKGGDTAYGLEVESMRVRDYHDLIVKALLQVLPFEQIVLALRHEATAEPYSATFRVRRSILEQNEDYQKLLAEFARLEQIKEAFENEIEEALLPIAEEHKGDFWEEGDDPEPADFERHVVEARTWTGPWRPFDANKRTELLVEWLQEDQTDIIQDFVDQGIEF